MIANVVADIVGTILPIVANFLADLLGIGPAGGCSLRPNRLALPFDCGKSLWAIVAEAVNPVAMLLSPLGDLSLPISGDPFALANAICPAFLHDGGIHPVLSAAGFRCAIAVAKGLLLLPLLPVRPILGNEGLRALDVCWTFSDRARVAKLIARLGLLPGFELLTRPGLFAGRELLGLFELLPCGELFALSRAAC